MKRNDNQRLDMRIGPRFALGPMMYLTPVFFGEKPPSDHDKSASQGRQYLACQHQAKLEW